MKKLVIIILVVLTAYILYKNMIKPMIESGSKSAGTFYGEPVLPIKPGR